MTHPRDMPQVNAGSWNVTTGPLGVTRTRVVHQPEPPAPEPTPDPPPPPPPAPAPAPAPEPRVIVVEIPAQQKTADPFAWTITIRQAAKMLNLHYQSVYKLARSGRLPSRRVLNSWRFREQDIIDWVENQGGAA